MIQEKNNSLKENILSFFNERTKLLLLLLFVVFLGGAYQMVTNKNINAKGIVVKCTVLDIEGRKGGLMITLKYKFQGHEYQGRMGTGLGKNSIGKQYFIKLVPYNPKEIVLLEDNPVPPCLLNVDAPASGWNEIPNCE
jgi:hypothetical protein